MYAITASSFRAVTSDMPLAQGETRVSQVPDSLLRTIEVTERRMERSQLLRDTDWTQMPDAQLSAVQRAEMSAYRQALRDLPDKPGFPDCEWPVAPDLGKGAASGPDMEAGPVGGSVVLP